MSSPEIRITIPGDPYLTSQNRVVRYRHWGARKRLYSEARQKARACWLAAGKPTAPGKVRVSVLVRRGKVLDESNVWSGLKPWLDGLFVEGITPDDSPRYVQLGEIRQETGQAWCHRPEVQFLIEVLGT